MSAGLQLHRDRIDDIDKQMAMLFEARMQTISEVAEFKKLNNLPTFAPNREQEMIAKNSAYIKDEDIKRYYVEFLLNCTKVSKDYQEFLKNK